MVEELAFILAFLCENCFEISSENPEASMGWPKEVVFPLCGCGWGLFLESSHILYRVADLISDDLICREELFKRR